MILFHSPATISFQSMALCTLEHSTDFEADSANLNLRIWTFWQPLRHLEYQFFIKSLRAYLLAEQEPVGD